MKTMVPNIMYTKTWKVSTSIWLHSEVPEGRGVLNFWSWKEREALEMLSEVKVPTNKLFKTRCCQIADSIHFQLGIRALKRIT